eukprot:m51a1_g13151 hypothetical protein (245) ;mRNA; f:17934-19023
MLLRLPHEWALTSALLPTFTKLFLYRFGYSDGKMTNNSESRESGFTKTAREQYGVNRVLDGKPQCRCLLTNAFHAAYCVQVLHIFKLAWSGWQDVVGLDAIDDVRNAITLWKPIEMAFDQGKLYFAYENEEFVCHIADRNLVDQNIELFAGKLRNDRRWVSAEGELKFGDLEGRPLVFTNPLRPYKRVRCFQATMVWTAARKNNWPEFPMPDYWNEGFDATQVRLFLNSLSEHVPLPPEEEDTP